MPANRTKINSYTYKYLIELPQLTQRVCGRELVVNASGNKIKEKRLVFLTNCKYGSISPVYVKDALDFRLVELRFVQVNIMSAVLFPHLLEANVKIIF